MKSLINLITLIFTLTLAANTFAFATKNNIATGESYFDAATGHRYIKNPDATYREYTKKGELFRVSVSPDLPLLTTNKYLTEIGRDCFVVYEKLDHRIIKKQILPASIKHPKGWYAKNAIACPEKDQRAKANTGPGYSGIPVATKDAYFDTATGHRYVKNKDATYREYTKKGDLFRPSVAPDLPLLTTNRHIREIRQNCYLLYQRNLNQKTEVLVLPSDLVHPDGWSIKKMLMSKSH